VYARRFHDLVARGKSPRDCGALSTASGDGCTVVGTMASHIGRRPEDDWLAIISNRNG
jgi:hypothetical protein